MQIPLPLPFPARLREQGLLRVIFVEMELLRHLTSPPPWAFSNVPEMPFTHNSVYAQATMFGGVAMVVSAVILTPIFTLLWSDSFCIGLVVLCTLCGKLGEALAPAFAHEFPSTILALNASDVMLALTLKHTDELTWLTIALLRRTIEDTITYHAARVHGPKVLAWAQGKLTSSMEGEERSSPKKSTAKRKKWLSTAVSLLAALVFPNAATLALAGISISDVPTHRFAAFVLLSTLARLAAFRAAGATLWGGEALAFLHAVCVQHTWKVTVAATVGIFLPLLLPNAVSSFRKKEKQG